MYHIFWHFRDYGHYDTFFNTKQPVDYQSFFLIILLPEKLVKSPKSYNELNLHLNSRIMYDFIN